MGKASVKNDGVGEQETGVSPSNNQANEANQASGIGSITRYEIGGDGDMVAYTDGDYVRYDDHIRAILNPMNQTLCKDMPALYRMFQFLLDNIADLEQSPDFAGFKMQRATSDEGELQFIRLIPCDNIAGVTAPRYADPENKVIKKAVASTIQIARS